MSWWNRKKPAAGSLEEAIASKDVDAAMEYLTAFVDGNGSIEVGRALQAIAIMLVEQGRARP